MNDRLQRFALMVLVGLLAAIGSYKAFQSITTNSTGSDALYFLGAAALVLVIDRLKGLERTKDGGWRAEFAQAIKAEVQKSINSEVKPQLKEIGNRVASSEAPPMPSVLPVKAPAAGSGTAAAPATRPPIAPPSPVDRSPDSATPEPASPLPPPAAASPDRSVALPPPTVADDPQKGRFGGKAQSRGRCLSAQLDYASANSRFYNVHLLVSRVDPSTPPLAGTVIFYLHDTFQPSVQSVAVVDGVARLSLLSFGAFTVGAIADGGATLLELDLSQDTRFPENFRNS